MRLSRTVLLFLGFSQLALAAESPVVPLMLESTKTDTSLGMRETSQNFAPPLSLVLE